MGRGRRQPRRDPRALLRHPRLVLRALRLKLVPVNGRVEMAVEMAVERAVETTWSAERAKRLRVDGRHRHRHRDGHLDPARRLTPRDGLVRAHRVRAVTHHQPVRDAAVIVVKRTGRDRYDGGRLEKTRRVAEAVTHRSAATPVAARALYDDDPP